MMFTRIAVVALCLGLVAISCSGAPPKDDAEPATQQLEAPETRLPIPKHTRMLLRVDPESLGELLEATSAHGEAAGARGLPTLERPEVLVAASLLTGHQVLRRTRSMMSELAGADDEKLRQFAQYLPSIDASRPILVAISNRGDEELMRRLRYGVPPYGWESFPVGMMMRVFIPTDNPSELRSELDDMRSALNAPENAIRHTESAAGYLVIDHHPKNARERNAPEAFEVDWEATDEAYWQRDTPALRAFLQHDSAAALYVRAEDLPAMGAFVGALELASAIGSATPENRRRMFVRGFLLAGQTFLMEDPEAREFEDMTLSFVANPKGGIVADAVRSYTQHGRQVASAGDLEVELPAIKVDDPQIEFEWAGDIQAAMAAAKQPDWLRSAQNDKDGQRQVIEMYRTGGIWTSLVPTLNYPKGLASAMETAFGIQGMSQFPQIERWQGLYAMRGRVALVEHASSPTGFAPHGAVVALVDPGSKATKMLERYAEMMRRALPTQVSLESEDVDDKKLLRMVFGETDADNVFGPNEPVGAARAHFDIDQVIEWLPADQLGRSMRRGGLRQLLGVIRSLKQLRIAQTRSEHASAWRVQVGTSDLEPASIPASAQPLRQPEPMPACLSQAIDASRDTLDKLDRSSDQELSELFAQLTPKLDAAQKSCAEDNSRALEEIAWIRARWQSYQGRYWAEQMHWERAAELFEPACEAGDERACADAQTTRERRQQLRLPEVEATSVELDALPHRPVVVARDELAGWSLGPYWGARDEPQFDLAQLTDADPRTLEHLIEQVALRTVEPPGQGLVSALLMPIDGRVSSKTAQALVELALQRDLKRERKSAQILGQNFPKGPAAAGFVVARPEGQTPHLGVLVMRSASDQSRPTTAPLTLAVTEAGVGIEYAGQPFDPIEGCPEDGPTLCVTDAEKAAGYVSSLLGGGTDGDMQPEEQAQALAELAKAYRAEALAEQLNAVEWPSESIHVVIRMETEVPFGLLAQLHGALNAWAAQRDSTDARPVVVLESD